MSRPLLEVCCSSADFAVAAVQAGADRVELCDNLVEGGTTPSLGAAALAAERSGVPVMAMLRPRGGDFVYSTLEVEVMLRDLEALKDTGIAGIVLGALRPDGSVDERLTGRLVAEARPLEVTFHRAFDLSRDLPASLEVLVGLGVDRVLTSAGRASVADGLDTLRALVECAADRIVVMPGGGIRPENVEAVLAVPGVREVHLGARAFTASPMEHRVPGVYMGSTYAPDEYRREHADAERIASVSRAVEARAGV